ncbi:MAG TPA: DUF58 domain-containing protein [Rhodanobacteraceae bacterium]
MPIRSATAADHAVDARVAVRRDVLVALAARVGRVHAGRMPVAADAAAGPHASHRRGRGMDYLESRAYQAGDDVRHLDWRLTARRGHLHTKVFAEEHEHRVLLLVDTHASMRFGTRERFKSVQAARAAALAAWLVARTGGRVGIAAFGPCQDSTRAAPGRHGALAVCAALERFDAAAASCSDRHEPLSQAMRRMEPLLRGVGQVLLISDGRSVDAAAQPLLAAWRRRRRLTTLLVTDALEAAPPRAGHFAFAWGGRKARLDLDAAPVRAGFVAAMQAPAQHAEQLCRAAAVACARVDTRADPLDSVMTLLRLRGGAA